MQQKLQETVGRLRELFQAPSVMASVYKDGKTFFVGEGLADIENGFTATENTIYAIASSSKAFVATAIAVLADEGKLKLDDPVRKHLPYFEMFNTYMSDHLTIRDALSHRSGLPRHDLVWLSRVDASMRDYVKALKYLPPIYEPRTRMYYQNIMFTLCCVIIEEVSGMEFRDFVKEKILDPLDMSSTFVYSAEYRDKGSKNESQPYVLKDKKVARTPFENIERVGGAGCLNSTVRDMDRWVRMHLNKGELDGVRIISEEMAKELQMPQTIIRTGDLYPFTFPEVMFENYCLGWFTESYRGHKLVHHGGTINGYKSQVGFLPNDNIAFSILTNLGANQIPNSLGYTICDVALGLSDIEWGQRYYDEIGKFFATFKDAAQKVRDELKDKKTPAHPLEAYVGKFEHKGYGAANVVLEDGKLIAEFLNDKLELFCSGHDNFQLEYAEEEMFIPAKFEFDFDGKCVKLHIAVDDFIPFEKVD